MLKHALLARLKSQPSHVDETEHFLKVAPAQLQREPDTAAWFALRFGRGQYGIFDAFSTGEGREAHLKGQLATELSAQAPLLFEQSPAIDRADVVASKMPPELPAVPITCGLLLSFRARKGKELKVEQLLRDAQPMAQDEAGTIAWFALRLPEGRYGIFDVFPDHRARFAHITGRVPRELTRHALTLLGGMPSMDMLDVLASHVAKRPTTVGLGVD